MIAKTLLSLSLTAMFLGGFSQDSSKRVITNYEYRQFVEYVRDSICYNIVQRDQLPTYNQLSFKEFRKKMDRNDLKQSKVLFPELFYPEESVIKDWSIRQQLSANEWDIRQYVYTIDSVNIYPNIYTWIDTNRCSLTDDFWDNDNYDRYSYDGVEVNLSKYYFTHPLFNDFPVQGLTLEQINAFENWKQVRDELKFSKSTYPHSEIKVDLDTSFWNITFSEYSELIKYSIDSIVKKHLYYEYSDSTSKIDYTTDEQLEIIKLFGVNDYNSSLYEVYESNKTDSIEVSHLVCEFNYWNLCDLSKEFLWITHKNNKVEETFNFMDKDIVSVLPKSKSEFSRELLNRVDQIPTFHNNSQLNKWEFKSINKDLTYPQSFLYYYYSFVNNNSGNYRSISSLIGQTPILFRRDWEKWVNDKSNLKTERTIIIPEKFYHK